mmetsp:Transcript_49/g.108  ORF Transcript_49/g.108 Transcript_49/m.108 type:complete len:202 (+) Transcript_49:586-1191(+)
MASGASDRSFKAKTCFNPYVYSPHTCCTWLLYICFRALSMFFKARFCFSVASSYFFKSSGWSNFVVVVVIVLAFFISSCFPVDSSHLAFLEVPKIALSFAASATSGDSFDLGFFFDTCVSVAVELFFLSSLVVLSFFFSFFWSSLLWLWIETTRSRSLRLAAKDVQIAARRTSSPLRFLLLLLRLLMLLEQCVFDINRNVP